MEFLLKPGSAFGKSSTGSSGKGRRRMKSPLGSAYLLFGKLLNNTAPFFAFLLPFPLLPISPLLAFTAAFY
jgi:hypothetical protein